MLRLTNQIPIINEAVFYTRGIPLRISKLFINMMILTLMTSQDCLFCSTQFELTVTTSIPTYTHHTYYTRTMEHSLVNVKDNRSIALSWSNVYFESVSINGRYIVPFNSPQHNGVVRPITTTIITRFHSIEILFHPLLGKHIPSSLKSGQINYKHPHTDEEGVSEMKQNNKIHLRGSDKSQSFATCLIK